MGPIPGVSWSDVGMVAGGLILAFILIWLQWSVAGMLPPGRPRAIGRVVLIALVVPFLVVSLYRDWVMPSEALRVATMFLWVAGMVLARLAIVAAGEWSAVVMRARSGGPSGSSDVRPNVLGRAATPNTISASPAAGPAGADRAPSSASRRFTGLLVVLGLAALLVAPKAVVAVAEQTPCETVEVLLADGEPETLDLEPIDWMPDRLQPGYVATAHRPVTLETLVQRRRNPDESRVELMRDGYLDGYEQSWESPRDHVEFEAQRFATTDGAAAFQAFANRYACQFANVAFRGPRGSVGLQIRFASGKPIGEQVSWVSGSSRILVFVDHDAPPADHSRVESLVGLVPAR